MSAESSRRESLDLARLAIARFQVDGDDGPQRAMHYATRTSAEKLACARVGVWLFVGEGRRALASPLVYDLARAAHDEDGQVIDDAQCPAYFEALGAKRVLAVEDALGDPRTRELADEYLLPRGIGALLDVPIYRGGEMVGVLCHEHAGSTRAWTDAECGFATSVADMLAVVLESARLLDCERRLRVDDRRTAEARHDESVARIAGAIGHDVNNLLTIILSATSSLASNRRSAESVIREAAERGATLARELLQLARGNDGPAPAPALAARVLESLRPLLEEIVAPHELDLMVDSSTARIPAEAQELERIVVNLVKNSRDALASPGRVSIRSTVTESHVTITVSDTGCGMSANVVERAFEPFFTTKQWGSGLGLASVRSIVTQRGGRVLIDSREGVGTTFLVELPRVS